MTYVADTTIAFTAAARKLLSQPNSRSMAMSTTSQRSDGSELVPTEVVARIRREGKTFMQPISAGSTVDQEGLTNNYAIEPDTYLALFPTPEQQQAYLYQGAAALLLVTLTILTAFAVS